MWSDDNEDVIQLIPLPITQLVPVNLVDRFESKRRKLLDSFHSIWVEFLSRISKLVELKNERQFCMFRIQKEVFELIICGLTKIRTNYSQQIGCAVCGYKMQYCIHKQYVCTGNINRQWGNINHVHVEGIIISCCLLPTWEREGGWILFWIRTTPSCKESPFFKFQLLQTNVPQTQNSLRPQNVPQTQLISAYCF